MAQQVILTRRPATSSMGTALSAISQSLYDVYGERDRQKEEKLRGEERAFRMQDRAQIREMRGLQMDATRRVADEYKQKSATFDMNKIGEGEAGEIDPKMLSRAIQEKAAGGAPAGQMGPSIGELIGSTTSTQGLDPGQLPEARDFTIPGIGGQPDQQVAPLEEYVSGQANELKEREQGYRDKGLQQVSDEVFGLMSPAEQAVNPLGEWRKGSDLASAVEPEEAAGAPTTKNIGGRMMGWNPETRGFDIDYGVAGTPKSDDDKNKMRDNPFLSGARWDLVDAADNADRDLTPEEVRQFKLSLPTQIRRPAQSVADHKLDPSKAGRGVEMRTAIITTAGILNKNYSQHGFEYLREWKKGKPAVARRAVNDAMADAGRAFELSKEFKRSGMPWLDTGWVWFLSGVGSKEEKALRTRIKALATEFAKAQNNGMAPKEVEVNEAYQRYATIRSPEELEAILREDLEMTLNRMVTLENEYRGNLGHPPPVPLLNRQTVEAAKKYGYDDILNSSGLNEFMDQSAAQGTPGAPSPGASQTSPEGEEPGDRKMMHGKLVEWDGTGYVLVEPEGAVEPGTGPLAQSPAIEDAMKYYTP